MPGQDRTLRRALFVAACVSSTGIWQTAYAQKDSPRCAESAQAVRQGQATANDLRVLAKCPSSGPQALSKLWAAPDLISSVELSSLLSASKALRDNRLYQAALAASRNAGHSLDARLASLELLTAYYDRRLAVTRNYLTSATLGDPIPAQPHAQGLAGDDALPEGRAREIPELLADLAQNETDAVLRGAALRLRQALAYRDPQNIPVREGVVALRAGCGPRVAVESSADISLPLRVRVLGTPYDETFWLKGLAGSKPSSMLLAPPAGTVVVSIADRELARLTKREAPCPPGLTKR